MRSYEVNKEKAIEVFNTHTGPAGSSSEATRKKIWKKRRAEKINKIIARRLRVVDEAFLFLSKHKR